MNKKLILGMMAVVLMTSAHAMAQRANSAAALRTEMTKYIEEQVKPHVFGSGKTTATGLAAQATRIANDKIINRLDLNGGDKANLQAALTLRAGDSKGSTVVETRLNNLTALLGAREIAKKNIDNVEVRTEAESILKASDALVKTIANSVFTRAKLKSDLLTKEEMDLTSTALDKLESLGESVIKMDKAERDLYAAVEVKRDTLLQEGRLGGEEALVTAIMQVRGISKEKAMEIVKKLKDCV